MVLLRPCKESSWIRNSVSRINLDNTEGVMIHDNSDFNDNEFELWIYKDVERKNGIVVAFSSTRIQLYLLQNNMTIPTKTFK